MKTDDCEKCQGDGLDYSEGPPRDGVWPMCPYCHGTGKEEE